MTSAARRDVIDVALEAAFPGLPDGVTMEEARRRISAAVAAVDWQIREEAASGVLAGVRDRIRAHGEATGDPETARAYERAALGEQ